jgi:CRISPR-associated protein Cmr5
MLVRNNEVTTSKKSDGIFNDEGEAIKEMTGYISSFGASIIQCGLLPAVALFSKKDGGGKSKLPLMKVIYALVGHGEEKDLLACVLSKYQNPAQMQQLQSEVMQAAIALKLAMRTFNIEKSTKVNN